jgi:hypothetical protein
MCHLIKYTSTLLLDFKLFLHLTRSVLLAPKAPSDIAKVTPNLPPDFKFTSDTTTLTDTLQNSATLSNTPLDSYQDCADGP